LKPKGTVKSCKGLQIAASNQDGSGGKLTLQHIRKLNMSYTLYILRLIISLSSKMKDMLF
jgi:hypothetical protein